jgi:hypothetical protein
MPARAAEEPLAWGEIESWLDELEQEEIVEDRDLEEARREVNQLRSQPMEDWYRHSSLEAGDSLREQTARSIRDLAQGLRTSLAGISAVDQFPEGVPAELAELWEHEMGKALEDLELGSLSLDPELLRQLKAIDIDPAKLRPLTDAELAALKEALKKGLKACQGCVGSGTNVVVLAAACEAWGRGGITRGPGAAPLFLKDRETRLNEGKLETVANPDYGRAALGDPLAVMEGEHEIDETQYRGPTAAGAATALGEGGETVWRNPLLPEEQEVLTRYFR